MVGRDPELALVLERWRQAVTGEGQALLLVGEAGIGKSRLIQATLDAVAGSEHVALRCQCSPHHTGTALWPITQQLGFAAGLAPADSVAAKLDKLETLLHQGVEDIGEAAPLTAALLGIDAAARYTPRDLTPHQQRARTLAVLVSVGVEYSLIVGTENSLAGALARGSGARPRTPGLSHLRRPYPSTRFGRGRRRWSSWENS